MIKNDREMLNSVFFFSSRRRHTRSCLVSWARRCVQETGINAEYMGSVKVKSQQRKSKGKAKRRRIMVFHWTNFVVETNQWWIRRVRPVWMGAGAIWIYWVFRRYYFFGKDAANHNARFSDEEWTRRAAENKRNWGYHANYKPELARSRKKLMLETLGDKYEYPLPWAERFMIETKSVEKVMEEENNWEPKNYQDQRENLWLSNIKCCLFERSCLNT
eukprot:TRINITY_DN270_c0_g1_i1.p1 TRINITY_DN270_c0_g1~~TRINITY_DN270_c0_g1_i1.p1  ORF type:complete len:217 (+),score=59.71 TRINITY_DN270_c0_g1_i1:3-653(+)